MASVAHACLVGTLPSVAYCKRWLAHLVGCGRDTTFMCPEATDRLIGFRQRLRDEAADRRLPHVRMRDQEMPRNVPQPTLGRPPRHATARRHPSQWA